MVAGVIRNLPRDITLVLVGSIMPGERRLELRRLTAEPPSACLRRLYFDTCVFRPDLIGNLVRLASADRVMLGSDYPFDMGDPDPLGT